jgi:RHS repeat-associated protein
VSPILFYDPVDRVVVTLNPEKTYGKVVFDPWRQVSWDASDTVLAEPATDPDAGAYVRRLPESAYLPTWYRLRIDGGEGPAERAAAEQAARHADTPAVAVFDTLGRIFLGIDDNGGHRRYRTRTVLDIEGNRRAVVDALDREADRRDFAMGGVQLREASMDAGERWLLNDIAGKPVRSWNSRRYEVRTDYDALRRQVRSFARGGDPYERNARPFDEEILFERIVYGDGADAGLTEHRRRAANLRGKPYRHFDTAGIVTADQYDFKGNLLHGERQLVRDHRSVPDWSRHPELEPERFASAATYDALNRSVTATSPDGSVYHPGYDETALLERIDVVLRGAAREAERPATPFVRHIDYNARSQRTRMESGNGTVTTYRYDPETFRLIRLKTERPARDDAVSAQIFADEARVQDLHYTYDPVGNVTEIVDRALREVFHRNRRIDPVCRYVYDPLYRLIEATGRENIGQAELQLAPPDGDYRDYPYVGAARLGDPQALQAFVESYQYDPVGNFISFAHRAERGGWKRRYAYCEESLLEPGRRSNRLSQTQLQEDGARGPERCLYDADGNITQMPHLPTMQWDFMDRLAASARQVVNQGVAETTFYQYDSGGQRVRKVTERPNGKRKNERLYVGGFEVFREYDGDGETIELERDTLHVMDDKQRIALVETLIRERGHVLHSPEPAQRYQLANDLGSATLELDEAARLISYEEYAPYGATVFQAGRKASEVRRKRYRYTGQERDEENGFSYHGARYYAPWLGRWTACDPAGFVDGPNVYAYGRGDPVGNADRRGTQCDPTVSSCAVDPAAPTPREEALQQSLPEDERNLPAASFAPEPEASPSPESSTPAPSGPSNDAAQWELGPRGEHIPTKDWQGGPLRPIADYDKPMARDLAAQGDYEAAELAQNYLCASCHILTKVDPSQVSIGGYARGWQRGYIQGLLEAPLKATPIGAAWEIGVSGGQALTGEGSGLHISNISSAIVDHRTDMGVRMTNMGRFGEGANFVIGVLTMGLAARAPRLPAGNPFANLSEAEIDAALAPMQAGRLTRAATAGTEAGFAPESMIPVSRWGRPGLRAGDWVMNGPPSRPNYGLSFKWDPNPTNIRAPFAAGEGYLVPRPWVRWPSGWGLDGWWKGLFTQRLYVPPPGAAPLVPPR